MVALQWACLIELCQEAFDNSRLELWVLAISCTTGIIDTVYNAVSFDGLNKRPGYGNGGFLGHLICMVKFYADPEEAFQCAHQNFI